MSTCSSLELLLLVSHHLYTGSKRIHRQHWSTGWHGWHGMDFCITDPLWGESTQSPVDSPHPVPVLGSFDVSFDDSLSMMLNQVGGDLKHDVYIMLPWGSTSSWYDIVVFCFSSFWIQLFLPACREVGFWGVHVSGLERCGVGVCRTEHGRTLWVVVSPCLSVRLCFSHWKDWLQIKHISMG